MLILKCDCTDCENSSINSKVGIYEISKDLVLKLGIEHVCGTHLKELNKKENIIIDSQDMKVFAGTEVIEGGLSKLTIFTDGACKGNPGKSASGIVVYRNNEEPVLFSSDYEEKGTNNTAELKAFYQGLLVAEKEKLYFNNITIKTDSQYTINSITKWADGWEKNGWKKRGGEIKNLDLIKEIHSKYKELKNIVKIKYVKGHAGIEGNELADYAANQGIELSIRKFSELK